MCGRFTLARAADLARVFDAEPSPDFVAEPRYNIAPTQPVAVVRLAADSDRRTLGLMK